MHKFFAIVATMLILSATPLQALRVNMIGNSLTDHVRYEGFTALANSAGYTHIWTRQMIPGSSIRWNYEHSKDGFTNDPYGQPYFSLRDYAWDVMTLQPTSGMGEDTLYARKFIEMALRLSPFIQVYMYSQNPYQEDRPAGAQLDAAGFDATMNKTTSGELSAHGSPKAYWEAIPVKMRVLKHIKPVLMIPVGQVLQEFNRRAALSEIPGYTSAWGLYSDGAHLNNVGCYLVGLTFFATIYKEDPRTCGVPSAYGSIPATVAGRIRECVWTVVFAHPLTGVKETLEIISHDTLPVAYDHVYYVTGFGATRPRTTFSVSSGNLPPGLTLDGATGMITGKPTQTGVFTFTLRADDSDPGTPAATLTRTITVMPAPPPQILTTVLDSVWVGCSYRTEVSGAYAYDAFTWSAQGLPQGLSIEPSTGVISGIPTQTTRAAVTVSATDRQGRTASRTLQLTVRPRPLNGLDYEYFDRDTFHSVNSIIGLTPDKIGITQSGISSEFRETPTGFAFRLRGWIRIQTPGRYTFRNGADYGTIMTVAGRAIPNNGRDEKMYSEKTDTITLSAGFHRFEYVSYNRDGAWLNHGWKLPGASSFDEIPPSVFYCDSAGVTSVEQWLPAVAGSGTLMPPIAFDVSGRRVHLAGPAAATPGVLIMRTANSMLRLVEVGRNQTRSQGQSQ